MSNERTLESFHTVGYIDAVVFCCYYKTNEFSGEFMKTSFFFLFFAILFIVGGCAPLALRPADFSWPVDVVVKPDSIGTVQLTRYQVSFNIKALLFEELKDSVKVTNHAFHIIRDKKWYYFITAKDFKNVYVFTQKEGALELEKKIFISEKGLKAPALNQKPPFIELVNEADKNESTIILLENGIQKGGSK
jgi:hypothetical protein